MIGFKQLLSPPPQINLAISAIFFAELKIQMKTSVTLIQNKHDFKKIDASQKISYVSNQII